MSRTEGRKRRGWLVALIILLVLALAGAGGAYYAYNYFLNFDEAYQPENDTYYTFTIAPGSSSTAIANKLQDSGLIESASTFKLKAKFLKIDSKFEAGEFQLSPSMTMSEIMTALQDARKETVRFTIPEGYDVGQMAEKLSKEGLVDYDEFMAALDPSQYSYWFLEGDTGAKNRLEGYLFPSTYEVYKGASAKEIVNKMLAEFGKVFTPAMREKAQELGISVNDAVTIASIIEKEIRADSERAIASSVIYNRLAKDMLLQMDSTTLYAMGEHTYSAEKWDPDYDSPYNTYKYPGLPPGPICAPGKASLEAAVNPEDTNYLYFVLKPDDSGLNNFSETYEQHKKYVEQYRKYMNSH
jgi:UPF0755 protein